METGLTPIFLKSGERDVLNCVMQGKSAKEIAKECYRTEAAIKARKAKIFKKYKVKNSIELLALFTEIK